MIEVIDRFIDTKQKRYHLFFFIMLLCAGVIVIPYVILGLKLTLLHSYDSIYDLFDMKILQYTYISRVVFSLLGMHSYSIMEYMVVFLDSIHPIEVLFFLLIVIGYEVLITKKIVTRVLILECIQFIALFICILFGIQSSSLMQAIVYIRIIGIITLIVNSIILFNILKYLILRIKQYKNALNYVCIEEKDYKI